MSPSLCVLHASALVVALAVALTPVLVLAVALTPVLVLAVALTPVLAVTLTLVLVLAVALTPVMHALCPQSFSGAGHQVEDLNKHGFVFKRIYNLNHARSDQEAKATCHMIQNGTNMSVPS